MGMTPHGCGGCRWCNIAGSPHTQSPPVSLCMTAFWVMGMLGLTARDTDHLYNILCQAFARTHTQEHMIRSGAAQGAQPQPSNSQICSRNLQRHRQAHSLQRPPPRRLPLRPSCALQAQRSMHSVVVSQQSESFSQALPREEGGMKGLSGYCKVDVMVGGSECKVEWRGS